MEMTAYKVARQQNDLEAIWFHLERAHIIGQRYPCQHAASHWEMLKVGLWQVNIVETSGQLIRLLLSAPFSFINHIPVGNPGSTRFPLTKTSEVPMDIQQMFDALKE